MDTTETFIKMCEKAEEIQELWKPAHGDWYKRHDDDECFGFIRGDDEIQLLADFDSEGGWFHLEPEHIEKNKHIWLPRQDQLQEMLGGVDKFQDFWFAFYGEDEFFYIPDWAGHFHVERPMEIGGVIEYRFDVTSMEQLWLAFYMKEKYSKQWLTSKQEWVKI